VHGRTRQQFYKGSANLRAVADVKSAVRIPVIVNGDVMDAATARTALAQSGADAVMVGRGAYGRPWIGSAWHEPSLEARLAIVLDHFADTLSFYGDALGLRVFRKHLGWYVERVAGREVKAQLCRLPSPREVEHALIALFGMREAA
jgi:tRNA-dihydrouridine synthase